MNAVRKALKLSDKFGEACDSYRNANPGKLIRNDDDFAKDSERAFNAGARSYREGWPYPMGEQSDMLWFRQRGYVAASELDNG